MSAKKKNVRINIAPAYFCFSLVSKLAALSLPGISDGVRSRASRHRRKWSRNSSVGRSRLRSGEAVPLVGRLGQPEKKGERWSAVQLPTSPPILPAGNGPRCRRDVPHYSSYHYPPSISRVGPRSWYSHLEKLCLRPLFCLLLLLLLLFLNICYSFWYCLRWYRVCSILVVFPVGTSLFRLRCCFSVLILTFWLEIPRLRVWGTVDLFWQPHRTIIQVNRFMKVVFQWSTKEFIIIIISIPLLKAPLCRNTKDILFSLKLSDYNCAVPTSQNHVFAFSDCKHIKICPILFVFWRL